jgi:AmmeMemoRadiSam system protein B
MVPVLCGSLRADVDREAPAHPFLDELRRVLAESPGRTIVVAAADLAHVGLRFGDPEPLDARHLGLLEARDRETLSRVAQGDAAGFGQAVLEGGDPRRICGLAPIYAALAALDGVRGKLLRYEQADDPTGTVTYGTVGLWG